MSDAMALVTVDGGGRSTAAGALRSLADAFRAARLPVVHAVDAGLATSVALDAPTPLDLELLADGGVQTLGPAELAIALAGKGAFDATPLDAVLRGLGVHTVVVGGPVPSARVSASMYFVLPRILPKCWRTIW